MLKGSVSSITWCVVITIRPKARHSISEEHDERLKRHFMLKLMKI